MVSFLPFVPYLRGLAHEIIQFVVVKVCAHYTQIAVKPRILVYFQYVMYCWKADNKGFRTTPHVLKSDMILLDYKRINVSSAPVMLTKTIIFSLPSRFQRGT
jgi:hypothetical protein